MVLSKFSPILGLLRDLEVLPPADLAGFQVFGLRLDPWHKRISRLHTLGEPKAGGSFSVREMDLHKGAAAVWLMNGSDRRIFLPAGERIPGMGAERRLRVSLVLGAQETLKVQADLLETNLQADEGQGFAQAHLPRDASGALFARGGRILGLDLFDRHETLRRLLPVILRKRIAQGSDASAEERQASKADVEAWLERASSAMAQVRPSLGMGREVLIEDPGLRGRCLFLDEGLVHAEIDAVPSLAARTPGP